MRLIALRFPFVTAVLLLTSAAAGATLSRARSHSAARASEAVLPPAPPSWSPPVAGGAPSPVLPATLHGPSPPAEQRQPAPEPGSPQAEVDRWTAILSRDAETPAALGRLQAYSQVIQEALAVHRVPADFAALPIIESGLLPQATSRVGAAGMWQLMPATARAYGLEVSWWVDERRDPIRSTQAAARFLRDLHAELGSWHLAAAAYNCGSGRLRAAIGEARSDEAYWIHRNRLPRETRSYVPKLLAAVRIANANGAGWRTGAKLRFTEAVVPGGVPLSEVAARYGVSTDTVARLNPHLVRLATPPGRPWPVRLPVR